MEKEKVNLLVGAAPLQRLAEIAAMYDLLWRGKPSLSALLEAVALRSLPVDWSAAELRELHQAVITAGEAGYSVENIAATLSGCIALPDAVRAELLQMAQRGCSPWVQAIEQRLAEQRPFELTYLKPDGKTSQHRVQYARLETIERHRYLCAWVEAVDELALPGLRHNRFFRLDRMENAVIAPANGKWRAAGLGTVAVKFRLFSGLAYSYNPKPEDSLDKQLSLAPPVREITRKISSAHWFLREFRVYGADAQLISPEGLVQQFLAEQRQMLDRYAEGG